MMNRRALFCGLMILLCVFFAEGADASIMKVDFNGIAITGDQSGKEYSGFFTYDDSLFTQPSSNSASTPGLEENLSFSLGPLSFNQSNASLAILNFDASGDITSWVIGGDSTGPLAAITDPAFLVVDDFILGAGSFGLCTLEGTSGHFLLSVPDWSISTVPDPVPEPASLILLGTGIAGLAGIRIRKKKA